MEKMQKDARSHHDTFVKFHFSHRITPHTSTGRSPAQLSMGQSQAAVCISSHLMMNTTDEHRQSQEKSQPS